MFHGNFHWITLGFDVSNLVPWNRVPLRLLVVKSTTQKSLNRRQSTKKWTIFPVYVSINNGWIIHLLPVMRFNQFLRGSQVRFVRHKFIVKNSEPKRSFFSKMSFFWTKTNFEQPSIFSKNGWNQHGPISDKHENLQNEKSFLKPDFKAAQIIHNVDIGKMQSYVDIPRCFRVGAWYNSWKIYLGLNKKRTFNENYETLRCELSIAWIYIHNIWIITF